MCLSTSDRAGRLFCQAGVIIAKRLVRRSVFKDLPWWGFDGGSIA